MRILLLVACLVLVAMIAMELPSIVRYIKIGRM